MATRSRPLSLDLEGDQRVESIASKMLGLIDDLKRKRCPKCGHPNLEPKLGKNTMAVVCTTPLARSDDYESGFAECNYSKVIHVTDIERPPFTLDFAAKKPATKPTTRRRTAS